MSLFYKIVRGEGSPRATYTVPLWGYDWVRSTTRGRTVAVVTQALQPPSSLQSTERHTQWQTMTEKWLVCWLAESVWSLSAITDLHTCRRSLNVEPTPLKSVKQLCKEKRRKTLYFKTRQVEIFVWLLKLPTIWMGWGEHLSLPRPHTLTSSFSLALSPRRSTSLEHSSCSSLVSLVKFSMLTSISLRAIWERRGIRRFEHSGNQSKVAPDAAN